MECQAITNAGTQCSRKAEPNSEYCWQHQDYESKESKLSPRQQLVPSKTSPRNQISQIPNNNQYYIDTFDVASGTLPLMLKALQPEILSKVKNYAGSLGDFSKQFNENTNKRMVIKAWFEEIGVQTPFDEVTDKDIQLLWPLYIKRIANAPPKDLLKKAIFQGLNPYLFHSRVFNIDKIPEKLNFMLFNYFHGEMYEEDDMQKLIQELNSNTTLSIINNNKVRKGDLVTLGSGSFISIFNGNKLQLFDSATIFNYRNIPENFKINDFPVTNYFQNENISDLVYFDTTDTKFELQKEYIISENNSIYKYITTGKYPDYIIWTRNFIDYIIFKENWNGILAFGSDSKVFKFDTAPSVNVKTQNTEDETPLINMQTINEINKIQSSRVLFESNPRFYYE